MIYPPIQCLTQDGIEMSHQAQVMALCDVGAKWIQLRIKGATDREVESVAEACLPVCRSHGARLIIDDRVDVALRVGADGVHLGLLDMPWSKARDLAGSNFLIGGTVNSVAAAERAVASGALDYVGVGPYRYTKTKRNLAAILSDDQWRDIMNILEPLPCFGIGGVTVADLVHLRELGLSGVAVCSGIYRCNDVAGNYRELVQAWEASTAKSNQLV
ncbi:thiamine phosphate synthase [Pelagicoccus sp. SDUM812002]|uniref:thiamine phosphate synthase n=1 Tax=Pelagicoccus sp. SDUM812002 TaxID=3041266 RepID=UPI00280CE8B3|nr:thiamine phosphate synthase [Pelagicoccus sp. SDUM812002]MDQ8184768.1 thiamine phosphate synthase [Pelagicoccus sp. SDUM812002]